MKRQAKNLPCYLERRLSGYALAASAAGVGMIALAQPAEAKIIYTKTYRVIQGREFARLKFDLNHDGIPDFRLAISNTSSGGVYLSVFGSDSENHIWTCKPTHTSLHGGYACALAVGVRVGPGRKSVDKQGFMEGGFYLATKPEGSWVNVDTAYLGLAFVIKGKTHYGWARIRNKGLGVWGVKATLTGYAYETIPNKSIITGKTKGRDVITMQEGSLGHLARGTFGNQAAEAKENQ